MEKQRKRMTACLVLAVIIIAIAAMVLIDIAATKITGVQLDVPDIIECSDTYTIAPEFSYAQRAPSEKRLKKELERLGMHYSSDDDTVLTVDEKGTIHAVGVGTAHITYADENEKLVATKVISVIISPKELIMPDTVRLTPGMVEQLNPSIEPANATYTDIQYISGDTAVAAVDVTGKIKGLEKGETIVTAKIKGTDIAAKTTVIVQPQIEKIEIKNATIRTKDGDTEQILYSIVPEDAFIDGISFQSENPEVATIDENGTLTAVASGSTTITVTAGDVSATCKVIVQQNMKAEGPMPGRIVIPELNINTGLMYGCTQEITDIPQTISLRKKALLHGIPKLGIRRLPIRLCLHFLKINNTKKEKLQWLKCAQKKSFRRKLRRNAERIATLTRKPATQQRTPAHPHTVLPWETGCRLDSFLTVLSKK